MFQRSQNQFLELTLGLLVIIILSSILKVAQRKLSQRRLRRKHGCQQPARRHSKDPFLGLDSVWETFRAAKAKVYLPHIRCQYEKYGNTYSSRFLTLPVLNTIEPENIQTILSTRFNDYDIGARRRKAFAPMLGHSIILLEGQYWEHSRARLRPIFKKSQVGDSARFEVHLQHLIQAIPCDGTTVDLAILFGRLTQDIVTDLVFGESSGSLVHPDPELALFLSAFQEAQRGLEGRWLLGSLAHLIPQRSFYRSVALVHKYFERHVEKALEYRRLWELKEASETDNPDRVSPREQESEGRYIFLRELAKVTENKRVLRDELLSIFLAGRDTTASLLSNLFFILARRPDLWLKIREEVESLDGAVPTIEQVNSMATIRNSLSECELIIDHMFSIHLADASTFAFLALRLDPPVPCNSRIACKDTVLPTGGGPNCLSPVFIPRGSMVAYHVTALHRRKDLWGEDADEFKPERWEKETVPWVWNLSNASLG